MGSEANWVGEGALRAAGGTDAVVASLQLLLPVPKPGATTQWALLCLPCLHPSSGSPLPPAGPLCGIPQLPALPVPVASCCGRPAPHLCAAGPCPVSPPASPRAPPHRSPPPAALAHAAHRWGAWEASTEAEALVVGHSGGGWNFRLVLLVMAWGPSSNVIYGEGWGGGQPRIELGVQDNKIQGLDTGAEFWIGESGLAEKERLVGVGGGVIGSEEGVF